jgi:hypothetical protein
MTNEESVPLEHLDAALTAVARAANRICKSPKPLKASR